MTNYTRHKIIRTKILNHTWFEVLFQKGFLNFVPGSTVTIYGNEYRPIFIASGIQEPWVRIILRRDLFGDMFKNFKPLDNTYIKLNRDLENKLPDLMLDKNPSFFITSAGVSPFFSYVSTYPKSKCKICYIGDIISRDWIQAHHILVNNGNELVDNNLKNLYIIGDRNILGDLKPKILNNCKNYYFT